ncbi:MAG: serine hydrolase domain-containing protein [Gemmatimonadaceae bacterium]
MTKTMTAAAIEDLRNRDLLSVETPLDRFLSGFSQADTIRLKHLLDHSSGLQDYYAWPEYAARRSEPVRDSAFTAIARTRKRDFAPGKGSAYSNTGYHLLASVIERVSGTSYAQFLATVLFPRAGWPGCSEPPIPAGWQLAPSSDPGFPPSRLQPAARVGDGWLKGNGSVVCSAPGLFRWAESTRSHWIRASSQLDRRYGWGLRKRFGRDLLEQTGRVPTGYVSYLGVYPSDDLIIVVLSSTQADVSEKMGTDLAAIALGKLCTTRECGNWGWCPGCAMGRLRHHPQSTGRCDE